MPTEDIDRSTRRTAVTGIYRYQTKHGRRYAAVASVKGHRKWQRGFTSFGAAKKGLELLRVEMKARLPRKPLIPYEEQLPKRARKPKTQLAAFLLEEGWIPGSADEDRVCLAFILDGIKPRTLVEQEFRLGPFRLDFAIPSRQIAIEADGPFHRLPNGIKRDEDRDVMLKKWGWTVHRIDTMTLTDEEIRARISAVLANV